MQNFRKGANNEDLLALNRALVTQHIKRQGVCSRAELANETGLTQASITKIIAGLIEHDIVKETGFIVGEKGRRSIGIALNADAYKIIGVKLSRKSFSVGLFDIGGNHYEIHSKPIDIFDMVSNTIDRIKEIIDKFLLENSEVVAIGIAVPGPYLVTEGKIVMMSEVPGWENISLRDAFIKDYDIPVFIEHDANAGALAEWWFGPHNMKKGVMVHVLAGEGIGAGIVVDGHVLRGRNGIAGEIGHMSIDMNGRKCSCGNRGCMETYCSSIAFVKEAKEGLKYFPNSQLNTCTEITADDIFNLAKAGDDYALDLVLKVGYYLGCGLANIVNAYDPDIIVISDIMSHGGDILLNEVERVVKERVWDCISQKLTIEYSSFEVETILYGAAAIATDRFLKDPSQFLSQKKSVTK